MNKNEEIRLTHSGILSIHGKPGVSVSFQRGSDIAEGNIPDCIITRCKGFTQTEVKELQAYLKENHKDLFKKASEISSIKHWL